jgi:hypothetical protein
METEIKYGLVELIQDADTEADVKALVSKGKSEYTNAHPKTVRRWNHWAEKRIKELKGPAVADLKSEKIEKVENKENRTEKRKFVKKK